MASRTWTFTGRILGVGTTSGVRLVVGVWDTSPLGSFADVMVERADGHRVLLAPSQEVADFVTGTYTFDATRIEPVEVRVLTGRVQVRTPTLVIHSEDDLRCPLSQAQRYHLGLVEAGVPTELLVFPGEDHELSRSGRPRHRLQRFEAILDWWDRYLPTAG